PLPGCPQGSFPVEDGIGVVDGFDLHHPVGAAGLPVQGPEELVGGGDFHLPGGEGGEHGVEEGGVGHQQGPAELLHILHIPYGGDEGDLQQAVGQVGVAGGEVAEPAHGSGVAYHAVEVVPLDGLVLTLHLDVVGFDGG